MGCNLKTLTNIKMNPPQVYMCSPSIKHHSRMTHWEHRIWAKLFSVPVSYIILIVVVIGQLLSCVQLFATPWTAAHQASLSFPISWSLLKLMFFELVMLSNHLILCHSPSPLPSVFPSIRVFFNESALCIRWPKYCSFSFTIQPSNEYSGLISFRIDWFDLLAVQGTLKSLF